MPSYTSPASTLTPEVALDPEGSLRIAGECYPEDPAAFFVPLLGALDAHARSSGRAAIRASFRLAYVNSASVMGFRRVFLRLEAMASQGRKVWIAWEHDEDDEASLELLDDLADGLRHAHVVEIVLPAPPGA